MAGMYFGKQWRGIWDRGGAQVCRRHAGLFLRRFCLARRLPTRSFLNGCAR